MTYRIARVSAYVGRRLDLDDEGTWLDFLDDFGPVLSRFLISPACVQWIPTGDPALAEFRRTLEENPLCALKPRRESVWILFAFKGVFAELPPPFRTDGILLPFEWRRDAEADRWPDADQVPTGLDALAARVRRLFGEAATGLVLRPDRCFCGQVDFNLDGATFDSGWGALAAGLARTLDSQLVTGEWPFSSIACDPGTGKPTAVGELARKFRLAADFGAEEFAVAPEQRREAERVLAAVKAENSEVDVLRRLRVFNWRYDDGDVVKSVRRLCGCNAYHGARRLLRHAVFDLAVFGFIFALAGAFAWDVTRETVEYYGDYVEDGGGVKGLFQMEERPDGVMSYEFRRQGWPSLYAWRRGERMLRSVSFVNAHGEMREDVNDLPEHRRFAVRLFSYDENGVLTASRCIGAGGRFLGAFRYSGENADIADAVQGGNRHIDGYAFLGGGDRVRRLRYVRDGKGRVAEIRFVRDSGDVAAEDVAGVSRVAFRQDELGRIVSKEYRDWRGEVVPDRDGVHRVEYRYEGDRLSSVRKYSAGGVPCLGSDGGDEIVFAYSDSGDLQRRTVRACGTNVSTVAFCTDAKGDRVGERHFGPDGQVRLHPWAERRMTYDAKGNLIREAWFDAAGSPLTRDDGCPAVIQRAYDENGLLSEETHYDGKGRLFAGKGGWARRTLRSIHSAEGTVIDRRYFGEDGLPTLAGSDRIAGERKRFDARGRLVGWELFGLNAEPVDGSLGWQRAEIRYDREGRREKAAFFNRKGERVK